MESDHSHMSRALHLARKGLGLTRPNPAVGAVLVRNGRILGEGYHRRAGGPHAEIHAIDSATEPVAGATLYCTLEPCCHDGPHKRTPPCTQRIISEGISRVVIASLDPNPQVDGRGVAILRDAGIQVDVGTLSLEASVLNEDFAACVRYQRPFVHLKVAQTLDGYLSTADGHSRWITDQHARTEAHRLRARAQAVLVGAGTVLNDDPELTVRHVEGPQPLRVVMAGVRPLPPGARLFQDSSNTLVYRPVPGEIRVDLRFLLDDLFSRGITSLLVEGGSTVLSSFLAAGIWDKLTVFFAFSVLGGGTPAFTGLTRPRIGDADHLQLATVVPLGSGFMVQGYRDAEELFGRAHVESGSESPIGRDDSDARREADYVYRNS